MTAQDNTHIPSRRDIRKQDRRDAIVTVAQAYFLEYGFAATTMSSIAAELGGSKGTLWSYFPSKDDLFAAVIERAASGYRAQLTQILDPDGPLEPTLKSACRSLIEKVTSPFASAIHRLIVAEGRRFPQLGQIFFDLAPQSTRLLLADFLHGAMERGQIRAGDPADAARALLSLSLSGCHQQKLIGRTDLVTADDIAADADFAVDIFLRAYALPPRSA